MRKLIRFTSTYDGSLVWIDPTQVVTVYRQHANNTLIVFRAQGSVTVTEGPEQVGMRINSALEAQTA